MFRREREFKQALELHQKCLAIEIKNLGSEHIDLQQHIIISVRLTRKKANI